MVDMLLVTALPIEYEALRDVLSSGHSCWSAVTNWQRQRAPRVGGVLPSYESGTLVHAVSGLSLSLAMAQARRMGPLDVGPLTAALAVSLGAEAILMSGVCAGNPRRLALGDVIISDSVWSYEEGKRTGAGLQPDVRTLPMSRHWADIAPALNQSAYQSKRNLNAYEQELWSLELLRSRKDPRAHVAFTRFFPSAKDWPRVEGNLVRRGWAKHTPAGPLQILAKGKRYIKEEHLTAARTITGLPFEVHLGPIASGSAVVKDGVTFPRLEQHVRTVLGLEMEAAAVGSAAEILGISQWAVIKGVMDHADRNKDDRLRKFAATASAEVLVELLHQAYGPVAAPSGAPLPVTRAQGHATAPGLLWAPYQGVLRIAFKAWQSIVLKSCAPLAEWHTSDPLPVPEVAGGLPAFEFRVVEERLCALAEASAINELEHEAVIDEVRLQVREVRRHLADDVKHIQNRGDSIFDLNDGPLDDELAKNRLSGLATLVAEFERFNLGAVEQKFESVVARQESL